ncbi:hypothetical protein L249_7848 [Ophiocordyceps polyrhachis-furcata BCC 54312]|uniref:Uncharacterized protein n=1 Tax=Ophiocordyceps polyrhachis-furcata BCC 54312 TaxID=1330021 RepID=A0A367L1G1_9HYPO|nr:hypothetical protein L249_7848 [Ophiocordyceps polyrhachis-furcata BCC 54312]
MAVSRGVAGTSNDRGEGTDHHHSKCSSRRACRRPVCPFSQLKILTRTSIESKPASSIHANQKKNDSLPVLQSKKQGGVRINAALKSNSRRLKRRKKNNIHTENHTQLTQLNSTQTIFPFPPSLLLRNVASPSLCLEKPPFRRDYAETSGLQYPRATKLKGPRTPPPPAFELPITLKQQGTKKGGNPRKEDH